MLNPLDIGIRHATDRVEADRVRFINALCGLEVLVCATLLATGLLRGGGVERAALSLTPLLVGAVPLLLHLRGRLAAARVYFLLVIPSFILVMLAAGYGRRGVAVVWPVAAICLFVVFRRASPRYAVIYGAVLSGLGVLATYVGLRWGFVPAHPPDVRAVAVPLLVGFGSGLGTACIALVARERVFDLQRVEASRARAARAEAARWDLLAAVSHELRTPVAAAVSLVDEARRNPAGGALDAAAAALEQELELLDDLFDVVGLEDAVALGPPRPLDLDRLLEARRRSVEAALPDHPGLRWVAEIPPRLGPRLGHARPLDRILRHLLDNALKFSTTGEVGLRVRAPDHETVVFEVEDAAGGLPRDRVDALFSALTQGSTGHDRLRQGLGIGLSVVAKLCAALGARLELESTPAGSVFRLTVALPPAAPAAALDLSGWRVLVVDDLAVNRRVLGRLVERLGGEGLFAADGREALEAWRRERPDLVLMDMQMPGMDGLEATRAIRAAGGTLPIVAVTANALERAEQECLEAGMDAYLTKPVRPEALRSALSRCAGSAARAAGPSAGGSATRG